MARDSIYGRLLNASKVPEWVFGGDYGDISNTLNRREMGYEQLQEQELKNEQRQMANDEARRSNDYENALGDIFANGQKPATLRDLYTAAQQKAIETGNSGMALKLEDALREQQQKEEAKKFSDLTTASKIAEDYSYEKTKELFPWMSKEDYNSIRAPKARAPGAPKEEKMYKMVGPDGVEEIVPQSQFNLKAKSGYKSGKSDIMDVIAQIAGNPNGSTIDNLSDEQRGLSKKMAAEAGLTPSPTPVAGTIQSGDIAPRDMKVKVPGTNEVLTIKKGNRIP